MNELIGFEYNAKNKKISEVNSLWAGELFVYPFKDEYKLCVKLGPDFTIETKTGRFFVNAYDILKEKFYNLYWGDEVFKFCGKIKIKGENVYGRPDLCTSSTEDSSFSSAKDSGFSSASSGSSSAKSSKIVHIKLPNEIERDTGIDPAYKANNKYNVLTFYYDACYFNTEYISKEAWEHMTCKSEIPVKNNCEVEIKIGGELKNGVLGAEWSEIPF